MANNNKKALKSGVWYTASSLLVKCLGFITTPIFARLLTTVEYGEYSNFLSWTNIAIILVGLRVESSLISARYEFEDRFKQYALSILGLSGVSTGIWLLLGNILSQPLSEFLGMNVLYINLMLLYSFFFTVVHVFQAYERYMFQYKRSVFISLLMAFSTTIISIILVLVMDDGFVGRALGHTVPVFCIGGVLLMLFFKGGNRIDISSWKFALKISLPYIPHLLSLSLLHSTNKLMITRMCGKEQNAMYSIAYTVGHMVAFLLTSMNMAFSPWLAEKVAADDKASIRKVTKVYIAAFSFLALGMMLLAPEILLVFGGRNYLEAKYVMPPIALSCVFQFLYTLYVNIEQIKKKTVGMAVASATAALLNIGLNLIVIPRFGYVSAAYVTLVCYLVLLLIHMYLVHRLNYADVYDTRIVFGTVTVMFLVMLGVSALYTATVLRYILVVVYGAAFLLVAWKFRKQIFDILRRDKKKSRE